MELDYKAGAEYWESVPSTVEGMLGGFTQLSEIDARGSATFIEEFVDYCGAGIGRVSKTFLLNVFDKVDIVEQNSAFVEEAKRSLGHKAEQFFATGLQDFTPEQGRYDVVWIQWVLGHLTDDDLVQFLIRCKAGVKEGGMVFVKENVLRVDGYVEDPEDSSMTRGHNIYEQIIQRAGLTIVKTCLQEGFPHEIFPVRMYALE